MSVIHPNRVGGWWPSVVLIVALRSVRMGLHSQNTNEIPATMAFGAWGLLVGQVGFADSVVAALTMGIVVDDSVHFLTKYLRARREKNLDAPDAVRYAFSSVGRALWVTSAVLVAGFAILAQSTFKQNSDMGLLAAVTIAFALLTDFLPHRRAQGQARLSQEPLRVGAPENQAAMTQLHLSEKEVSNDLSNESRGPRLGQFDQQPSALLAEGIHEELGSHP